MEASYARLDDTPFGGRDTFARPALEPCDQVAFRRVHPLEPALSLVAPIIRFTQSYAA